MAWTRKSVGVTVLLAMDEHRRAAGQRAAKIRESKSLTQEEVAQTAGVSHRTVSRFENGKHDGRSSTVKAIARALEVDPADLVGQPPAPLGLDAGPDPVEAMLSDIIDRLERIEAAIGDPDATSDPRDEAARAGEAAAERRGKTHDEAGQEKPGRQRQAR